MHSHVQLNIGFVSMCASLHDAASHVSKKKCSLPGSWINHVFLIRFLIDFGFVFERAAAGADPPELSESESET